MALTKVTGEGVEGIKLDSTGSVIKGTATTSNAHANADDLIIGNVPAPVLFAPPFTTKAVLFPLADELWKNPA